MSRKIRIEVTAEDIERGWIKHNNKCPVALALLRTIPDATYINVGYCQAGMKRRDDANSYILELPAAAASFIDVFDNNGPEAVKPMGFDVELPDLPASIPA